MKLKPWQGPNGQTGVTFRCPGCDDLHAITTSGPGAWAWNGSLDAPTFSPSVLVTYGDHAGARRCHSFVGCNGAQPGEIVFLSDCTHALAGQIVPLPDLGGSP